MKKEIMNDTAFDIPVVLFVFRRLDTVKTMMSILHYIKPKKMYIFSDGFREGNEEEKIKVLQVREYIQSAVDWDCDLYLENAERNKGCSKNICEGIDTVFSKEKYAIIFEDDVIPKYEFFAFAKILLEKYENNKQIQYIAGFNAIGDTDCIETSYTFSLTAPMSGAIAVWADRWNECDFSMKDWPKRKKEHSFRKFFYSKEMYKEICKAFDDSYLGKNEGWDYQFHYDQMNKGRYAIVPQKNLVRNEYSQGSFHGMSEKTALKFNNMMNYSKRKFIFPMNEPQNIVRCKEYDKLRQKFYLSVNGNYLTRHIKYMKRNCKELLYQYMPKSLWILLRNKLKN